MHNQIPVSDSIFGDHLPPFLIDKGAKPTISAVHVSLLRARAYASLVSRASLLSEQRNEMPKRQRRREAGKVRGKLREFFRTSK